MIKSNLLAASICLFFALAATAPEGRAAAPLPPELHKADVLMHTRPAEAVAVLLRLDASGHAAGLAAHRALLVRLLRAQLDLGNRPAAAEARNALLALGKSEHDPVSLTLVALNDIEETIRDFRSDEAAAALAKVKQSIDFVRMPDLAFRFYMASGRAQLLRAEYERAIESFHAGLDAALRMDAPEAATAEAYRNMTYAHLSLKDTDSAGAMIAKALAIDPATLSARMLALLHMTRGGVLAEQAHFADANAEYALALRIAQASDVKPAESRVLSDWADLASRNHDFVLAERLSRQAVRVAEVIGDAGTSTTAGANIGFALGGQGRVAEALVYIDRAVEQFRKLGDNQSLLAILDEKGRMLERQGRLKEALAVVRDQQTFEREQFTEHRSKALAALQERFESQQNRRQIELLEKQSKLKDADIRNHELRQVALVLAVLLMLAVGGLVTVLYKRSRRSNAQLRSLNEQLAESSVRDPLTGLYNRRSFIANMQARAQRPPQERRSGQPHAGETFMVLDLDHFKAVNDIHGHAAGDTVLVEVARRLQAAVRDTDSVLRWGGEEFVIHLPCCGADRAAAIAQRILQDVNGRPIDTGSAELHVSVSMGMIELPFAGLDETACDWQRALRLADRALYMAKAGGRNRCNQFLPPEHTLPIAAAELESDLDGALAAGHVRMRTVMAAETA